MALLFLAALLSQFKNCVNFYPPGATFALLWFVLSKRLRVSLEGDCSGKAPRDFFRSCGRTAIGDCGLRALAWVCLPWMLAACRFRSLMLMVALFSSAAISWSTDLRWANEFCAVVFCVVYTLRASFCWFCCI